MTITLDFLPQTAFIFFLIFARVGGMTMSLPGIGDRLVPVRVRLVFALSLTLILFPIMQKSLPAVPEGMAEMLFSLGKEVILGFAIGSAVKLIVSSLIVAGSAIAVQTGLAFAQNVDPTQGTQSSIISSFLAVLSVTLLFATDLHHLLFTAMHDSYKLFPVGEVFPTGDFLTVAIETITGAFRIALQMAAPFLVFGLVFFLGIGILSRLIPQMQVFFIAMPANIFLGFALLTLLLSAMMIWYLEYFDQALRPYLL